MKMAWVLLSNRPKQIQNSFWNCLAFLRPGPHISGYFWIHSVFFPDSKISPSTRGVFKSNSPFHTHPMVSGFTLGKQHSAAILVYCSVRDWTRSDSKIFVAGLFFSLWSGKRIKKFRILCRIRRMCEDRSSRPGLNKHKLPFWGLNRWVFSVEMKFSNTTL